MNPALIIALVDGALTLIEKFAPVVKELYSRGEITADQQASLQARIEALSQDDAFSGPEWKVD